MSLAQCHFSLLSHVSHFVLHPLYYSPKITNYGIREKTISCIFLYVFIYSFIYLFIYLIRYLQAIKRIVLTALGYHFVSIEVKDRIFRRNSSFRHLWQSINNPSSSNIFVQIIYSYLRYTYRLVDVFSLVICCNIIKASWETKMEIMSCRKTYIEEFIWGTSLFWQHTLFSMSCLLPPPYPKDVLVEWPLWRFIIKF